MLPDAGQIKKAARAIYKDNFALFFVVSFIFLASCFAVWFLALGLSSVIGAILPKIVEFVLIYLIIMPLSLGLVRFFNLLIEGKKVNLFDMFYYFSGKNEYKRALGFISGIFFIVLISAFAALIIPAILRVFANAEFYNRMNISAPIWTPLLSTAAEFLKILGIALVAFFNIKYYLSVYLFICDDEIMPGRALSMSAIISRRTKMDFIVLVFSMIGYIILSLPVLPLVFILPYFVLSYVVHGKCAAVQYNNTIEANNKQYTVVAK